MARQFRDQIGLINQRLASESDRVTFVIAGIETHIK
jgi:adenosyl cobinamide kinase/adenosyl cobinamide phosphate guanylyltransferase